MTKRTTPGAESTAAETLRAATRSKPIVDLPPAEPRTRLATVRRAGRLAHEIRITLIDEDGRPCVLLESWRQRRDGSWSKMRARGLRLRPDELRLLVDALARAAGVLAARPGPAEVAR